jgi:hypothetical protein
MIKNIDYNEIEKSLEGFLKDSEYPTNSTKPEGTT